MDLNEYIEQLINFRDEDPKNGKLTVIYAKDDEGNGYQRVHYGPTSGIFEEDDDIFYSNEEDFEEYDMSKDDINAVCIN